jgi:hypothetical protein
LFALDDAVGDADEVVGVAAAGKHRLARLRKRKTKAGQKTKMGWFSASTDFLT